MHRNFRRAMLTKSIGHNTAELNVILHFVASSNINFKSAINVFTSFVLGKALEKRYIYPWTNQRKYVLFSFDLVLMGLFWFGLVLVVVMVSGGDLLISKTRKKMSKYSFFL